MRSFFSLDHAGPTDHYWRGVLFHGYLSQALLTRCRENTRAASRDPLVSRLANIDPEHRRLVDAGKANLVPPQAGTPCDVYGHLCALYLWRDEFEDYHGLICLDRDNAARAEAFELFKARKPLPLPPPLPL